jgi:Uma2 family endonuclease
MLSVQVEKRVFNVGEYHKMSEVGILSEGDRVELIEGEIVKMSPIGRRHAACVNRITALFAHRAGSSAIVSVQNPILLNEDSEPQPDIALLAFRPDFYAQALPVAADVLLIIEVADSSMEYDRGVKLPLYARAGVPEVWLVDLQGERIEVCSEPAGETYRVCKRVNRQEGMTPKSFPEITLVADDLLG